MLHPPTVVVPLDFSPFAEHAFRYAAGLARPAGARLHLLHVAPDEPGGPVKNDLLAAAARAGVDLAALTVVQRTGERPAEAIAHYADEVGADLVVMSRHGRRGFRRFFLGSQTDEVLRTAPCPVLVVPNEADPSPRLRRLLVAVDLTDVSAGLVAEARAFAARFGPDARLHLLHVLAPLPYPATRLGEVAYELMPELIGQATTQVQALAGAPGARRDEVHVAHGPAAAVVLREADALGADLVVVASHGPSALDRVLIGSVTERIVRTADRPVLVVRGQR